MNRRSLHRLAEEIYYELEGRRVFDDDLGRPPRRNRGRRTGRVALPKKRKRRVSAYQKEFGRQLKKLKKKHPRTPVTKLMKRAHAATRKARRGK